MHIMVDYNMNCKHEFPREPEFHSIRIGVNKVEEVRVWQCNMCTAVKVEQKLGEDNIVIHIVSPEVRPV